MKIVINAGHGPTTPGKRSPDGTLREYQFNSAVALEIGALLGQYEGVELLHPFEDGRDVPLKERTDRANGWGAELYVSIHANAAGDGGWSAAEGIETFVYSSRPEAAVALAVAIQRKLSAMTGRVDRGVKSANFHELRETHCTAVLVECGFMTNKVECELLKSDEYRQKCALAILSAIVETYGLQRRPDNEPDEGVSPWAREAREWAITMGITDGSRPKDTVTREEVWTMLHRASKYPP